jgi:protein gp37
MTKIPIKKQASQASTAAMTASPRGIPSKLNKPRSNPSKPPADTESVTLTGGKSLHTDGTAVLTVPDKLTPAEQTTLNECVDTIMSSQVDAAGNFQKRALAIYRIQCDKLYRGEHPTEAAFFKARFGLSRSTSLRLAQMGRLLDRVSPMGDNALVSDAHLRPLLKLSDGNQVAVIAKAKSWAKMANLISIPAKLMMAAATFLNPPARPRAPKDSAQTKLLAKFHDVVTKAKDKLPAKIGKDVKLIFETLIVAVMEMGEAVRRSTGISWTEKTWNPLHGCTRASCGCDNCYSAKQTATRLADVYPGLAVKKTTAAGTIKYSFTGKIQLSPEDLAEPLLDHVPKMIFVNSMSDLFHKDVPEEFIHDLFTVMETAWWHTFQVLTKRPERMATFTQKRYADKAPPKNLWLGASTEDQAAYDERLPHLKQTKAAVRWLSVEPLIGPIQFGSMDGIDWIVVGGESGASARPMAKQSAADIRDACKTSGVPFFFKQWGAFNEQGKKEREISDVPTLDGVVHQEYPTQ